MGKAYGEAQRIRVRELLELGHDGEAIEKETSVSDRTIRRWKTELERTGRIGKPPESRTGRHRVLQPEVEAALFEHVKDKPDMSVDDMLWWLYDNFKIVVGTRTIRRVFERKGDKCVPSKSRNSTLKRKASAISEMMEQEDPDTDLSSSQTHAPYHSPYAPVPVTSGSMEIETQLREAMQQQTPQHPYPALVDLNAELPDDEETIQLQLHQIALQKREVELKLKMRQVQSNKSTPPRNRESDLSDVNVPPSSLFNPTAALAPSPVKRDSRSKKKIEESKRRTAERQERMLRDLERRSRRRDHLTAEWVRSKDIWPLRAQGFLADLMHQFGCYSYSSNIEPTFEAMYRELYQLVDLSKGDWDPAVHDDILRDRMRRKMGQLRVKMQKTGEIVGRADGYPGFEKAADYTGEQAGASLGGDDSEIVQDPALQAASDAALQQAPATPHDHPDEHEMHYSPGPSDPPAMQASPMSYPQPIMHHQGPPQYALMDQNQNILPYAPMGSQQGLAHQEGIVM